MYCGHLRLLSHISFKSTQNGLYETFRLHIYLDQIYIYFFYVFEICGSQVVPLRIYCSFNIEPHCFFMCVYINNDPQNLVAICRNIGIFMFSHNCPPVKYIHLLLHYHTTISYHTIHRNLTLHTLVFKTRGHPSGVVWSRQRNALSFLALSWFVLCGQNRNRAAYVFKLWIRPKYFRVVFSNARQKYIMHTLYMHVKNGNLLQNHGIYYTWPDIKHINRIIISQEM